MSNRSNNHSNKFIENLINKYNLQDFLSVKKQGWNIITFKTSKNISEFNTSLIPTKNIFSIINDECSGVADPFLIKDNNRYYLFFEYEYHKYLNKGADIAYAESDNGIDWVYKQKIITEPFHQSFPYVFQEDSSYYMIPESYQSNKVLLYKSNSFPKKWILDKVLFEGKPLVDTIFIKKGETYFWFTTDLNTNELLLFYSSSLKGKWKTHSESPISKSLSNSRNAGPILIENEKIFRLAQDCSETYGGGINMYEITALTIKSYQEKVVKKPLLYKNKGVYKDAIHHLNVLKEKDEKLIAIDVANFAVKKIKLKKKNMKI